MLEIEATEQNVLFPIPFTQWCVASGSRVTGTGGNPTTLGANAAFHQIATLTHAAVFSVEAQEYYLFAAGVQQWGYITESSSSTDYRYFPVPFATEYYAICTGNSQRQDNVSVWLDQIDTLKFLAGIGENYVAMPQKNIFYFACGRQQWGYQAVHGNAEQEFSLPIAFTNNPYTVAISTTNTGNHAACKGFTLSTITLDAGDDVNVDDNIGFIILGKQQWGFKSTDTEDWYYPIAFIESVFCVERSIISTGATTAYYRGFSLYDNPTTSYVDLYPGAASYMFAIGK